MTGSEVENLMRQWSYLHEMNMTDMTYEDYLRSNGIRVGDEETRRPELIRYVRDWQYPTNTVNPAGGGVSTAVSWSIQERADKDRFFDEPGFLFGVSVMRPKTYNKRQKAAIAGFMNNAYAWLPAILQADNDVSIKDIIAALNLFGGEMTNAMAFDIKDLLLYGDQFMNFPGAAGNTFPANWSVVSYGQTDGTKLRYPVSEAEVDALFTSASPAVFVETDGVVSLNILGRQYETSPRGTLLGARAF